MDDSAAGGLSRSASRASTTAAGDGVSRSNTLKKRNSIGRRSSLRRSSSRKSFRAGSMKSLIPGEEGQDTDYNSVHHTPIPTQGTPTGVLANRFQEWRVFLKSLIVYFQEIQTSYETRSKAIMKVYNVISNTPTPSSFITDGGLSDANRILGDYHKRALEEANKARNIEQDVIQALNGLRADLGAKIKEIKSLHGDFKNSVDKEKQATKKAIVSLEDALHQYDHANGVDKDHSDPFIVRINVDRFVERQIDEENYLHRAYLNLESSGRELESIVVGEIQKAYNALASILKREADDAYNAVDLLRSGPISMQKDLEWNQFVSSDPHLVNPDLPLRRVQDIEYPGKYHPGAAEIRAGMLERKSKYLKSYTAGWYVLSTTHLHEFKSADNIYSQAPIMSLYLLEQRLGSHSSPESSSHKFMLKGKQSGSMHRGHSWVFRAESYETMMAWFEAIRNLTERTGADKADYVRKHSRSVSGNSARAMSISSDGMEEDEADKVPYAASIDSQQIIQSTEQKGPQRPQPGGRFPSDLAVPRERPVTHSDHSSEPDQDTVQSPSSTAGSRFSEHIGRPRTPTEKQSRSGGLETNPYTLRGVATHESSPMTQREQVVSQAPMTVVQSPYDGTQNQVASHNQNEISIISGTLTADQTLVVQHAIVSAGYSKSNPKNVQQLPGNLDAKFGAQTAQFEYDVIGFLRKHCSVPVPRPVALLDVNGTKCLITERLPGVTLKECISGLSPAEAASKYPNVWRQIQQALAELYSIDTNILTGRTRSVAAHISLFSSRHPSDTGHDPTASVSDWGSFHQWALDSGCDSETMRMFQMFWRPDMSTALCHGDLQPGNIIIDPGKDALLGLIGWEQALVMPSEYDAVRAATAHNSLEWANLYMPQHHRLQIGQSSV